MRFGLSAEQRLFAAGVHDALAGAGVPGAVRAWGRGEPAAGLAVWRRLADLGVTALAVPEDWGGAGGHPADLVVAFEELGHHAVPGPAVESVAAVPALLLTLGRDELCAKWLPGLAGGDAIATLAVPPRVPQALDADVAEPVLVVDGDALRLAGSAGPVGPSVDRARRLFAPAAGAVLARGPGVRAAAARAFDAGALACAAQLLGCGRALLELATGYARQRVQFGQPIGAFQAVKHQLADVLVGLELARPLLYGAAVSLADHSPATGRDVSAAKVACADAAYRAARAALQVHGAIGYTDEHDLGLWLTKVRALVAAWGTRAEHRARVAAALLDGPAQPGRARPPGGEAEPCPAG